MSRGLDNTGKLLLRLTIGGLLFMHGLAKVRDSTFIRDEVLEAGLPVFFSYGVFVGEIVAPVLLVIGLFTRTAALLVATDMLFALALVHAGDFTTITPTGGWAIELPVLFLLGAVAISLLGPGRFAVAWNPSRDIVRDQLTGPMHTPRPITHGR